MKNVILKKLIKIKSGAGFTLVELLIALVIISVLFAIILTAFLNFKNNQAFNSDIEQIVIVLRSARNQTLSSKNASQYGVHFSSSKITLFTGSTYISNDPLNQDFLFTSGDTTINVSLILGGSDIIFNRLTGEVNNNGTVTVSSSRIPKTKVITVYKTGLIEL